MSKKLLVISLSLITISAFLAFANETKAASITITSPSYNEKWDISFAHNITWDWTDSFDSVGLTLLQNSQAILSIGTVSNTGSHSWTIPTGYLGSGYTIKAVNMDDYSVYDESNRFYIYDINDITSPSGPANIVVSKNMTSDPDYKLNFDYTTPSDTDYYCINIYRSTVSGQLGESVLNCVNKDTGLSVNTGYFPYEDSYIQSQSNGTVYFTVRAVDIAGNESTNTDQNSYSWETSASKSITVTYPNGGEQWEKGGEFNIEFEYSDIDGFMPFLAQGNQISYLIRSFNPTPVTGSPMTYTLTIPSDQSLGSYEFLLYGYKDNEKVAEDYSDAEIEIVSTNIPNLSLALSDELIPATVEKGAKQQVLIKADLIANNYEDIKVSSIYVDQVKYDINPIYGFYQNYYADLSNLKIHEVNQDGSLKFLSSTYNKVGLYDLFTSFSLIIPKGDKKTIAVTADIPEVTTATSLHIRLLTSYNLNYIDAKGMTTNQIAYFDQNYITGPNISIQTSSIAITSPNGGETFEAGKSYTIEWTFETMNVSQSININLMRYSGGAIKDNITFVPLATNVSNSGSYNVEIPSWIPAGEDYAIRIFNDATNAIDESDAPFSIMAAGTPSVNVTSPTAASTYWRKGETNTVYWTLSNFTNAQCTIELYKINIASLTRTIAINYSASQVFNNYSWTVPDDLDAGQYKVLVRCNNQGETITYEDKSDNYFSVIEIEDIAPPTNVTVTQVETNQGKGLKISWTNPSDTAVRIYRATTQNQLGNEYYSSLSTDTSFIDYNVTSGLTYYYTVRSYKEGNSSTNTDQYSGVLSISTPTPTPTPTPTECLPDNTLIKLPDDPKIYVIIDCKKKWIETIEEFQQENYQWENVQETSLEVVNAYADYLEAVANLIRAANQAKVYKIIDDKRLWIPTAESFTAMGNNWSDIQDVSELEVEQYPRLELAKLANNPNVYYLTENGLKRHIPTVEAFNSYNYDWSDIVEVSNDIINSYEDNALIMMEGDYKVYSLLNGIRRWIKTDEAFNRLNYDKSRIEQVSKSELFSYEEEAYIE